MRVKQLFEQYMKNIMEKKRTLDNEKASYVAVSSLYSPVLCSDAKQYEYNNLSYYLRINNSLYRIEEIR